jgi:hypothetical protein
MFFFIQSPFFQWQTNINILASIKYNPPQTGLFVEKKVPLPPKNVMCDSRQALHTFRKRKTQQKPLNPLALYMHSGEEQVESEAFRHFGHKRHSKPRLNAATGAPNRTSSGD